MYPWLNIIDIYFWTREDCISLGLQQPGRCHGTSGPGTSSSGLEGPWLWLSARNKNYHNWFYHQKWITSHKNHQNHKLIHVGFHLAPSHVAQEKGALVRFRNCYQVVIHCEWFWKLFGTILTLAHTPKKRTVSGEYAEPSMKGHHGLLPVFAHGA